MTEDLPPLPGAARGLVSRPSWRELRLRQEGRALEARVAAAHEHGKALTVASASETDDVFDPADTRRWVTSQLTCGPRPARSGKKRPFVDTW